MAAIGDFFLVAPQAWLLTTHGDVCNAKRRAEEYRQLKGSYEGAECVIEEFVRQWVLLQLLAAYKYPAEWLGERIIIEEPVKMGSSDKQADISIKNTNRRTFLYIETKKRGISDEEFREAERQLESYLASTHTATIGMVTDGNRIRTIRKKIDPNDFEYIPDLPACGLETRIRADIKGRAFQKILGPAIRAGMGQYFTPDPIVELAIGVIQPKASDLILDPFCGSGHFLTKALQCVVNHQRSLTPHDLHDERKKTLFVRKWLP